MLAKLLKPRRPPVRTAIIPDGRRVYAIGDIHGRLDLLDEIMAMIDADGVARPAAATTIVFLGDLVDRGPDSSGVVERLRGLAQDRADLRFLAGNHEEIFLGAIDGDDKALRLFCRIGGRETIVSYGVDPKDYDAMEFDDVAEALRRVVPAAHRGFLSTFEDQIVIGDYVFVHAGIRPGVALDDQRTKDMRWIREPFLSDAAATPYRVVHGHTISTDVEYRTHRIGIDTGGYASGVLTAIGLAGSDTWLLQTSRDTPGD